MIRCLGAMVLVCARDRNKTAEFRDVCVFGMSWGKRRWKSRAGKYEKSSPEVRRHYLRF